MVVIITETHSGVDNLKCSTRCGSIISNHKFLQRLLLVDRIYNTSVLVS